jgi:hypothetical protein
VSWVSVKDVPPENWKPNTRLLYTLASSNGWTHEAVKAFIKAAFNRDSTKDLLWSEYNATMEQLSNPYEED